MNHIESYNKFLEELSESKDFKSFKKLGGQVENKPVDNNIIAGNDPNLLA